MPGFAVTPDRAERPQYLQALDGEVYEAIPNLEHKRVGVCHGSEVTVNVGGHSHFFTVLDRSEHWAPSGGDVHGSGRN